MKNKFENIDDKTPKFLYPYFLCKRYKEINGHNLNLLSPKLLSEKIQWLKLFKSTKLKANWADKIKARELFCEKIKDGEQYLKPFLGSWNDFDEINFNELPNQFILKLNHGCGFNSFIINKENLLKNNLQLNSLKDRINLFKNTRYYLNSLELHYQYIKPMIFAEEIIGGATAPLYTDWMIYCFNGKPEFIAYNLHQKDGLQYSYIYNKDFKELDFSIAYGKNITGYKINKPHNFDKMFELAEILCKEFKFVRVDFIEYASKLYFAEMTFTPFSGYMRFNGAKPNEKESLRTDRYLGDLLKL